MGSGLVVVWSSCIEVLGSHRAEFRFIDLGEVVIRGKAEGVRVLGGREG